MYTLPSAIDYIEPYMPRDWIYWEMCPGENHIIKRLEKEFKIITIEKDSLLFQPEEWDCLLTNPPFSKNKLFIKRAIELNKPFALIVRLEHLGRVTAYNLLRDFDFQIIIPKRRINFITPKMRIGEKVGGAQFTQYG